VSARIDAEAVFHPPAHFEEKAHVPSLQHYRSLYEESIRDPEGFWSVVAQRLHWTRPFEKVRDFDFHAGHVRWFEGGKLNASANCLDRHVAAGNAGRIAYLWESNDPDEPARRITYGELLREVERFANVLKAHGVGKGDRVCLYMQMIPELPIAMLACARLGAVHSVVFGAFSAESLRDRINDAGCKILVTQDTGFRGPKRDIPMKANADEALAGCPTIERVFVVRRTGLPVNMHARRDVWWHEAMSTAEERCPPVGVDAEDPLFILYTSGSTGRPKGVLHTTGGYLVYTSFTHQYIFDYHPEHLYWCAADIGWITGHSYIVYGPLANGASSVLYEGIPTHPDFGRLWQIVAKHGVNVLYTAPTAIRALMKEGDEWPARHDLSSLRVLGTVGEPIKPPEWHWYYRAIGGGRCPIVDTWWQTETGGILITPLPGATPTKPGSVGLPFFGVEPVILDESGRELEGPAHGYLAIKRAWPALMRTVYGDHDRFRQTYFERFPGYYLTGDGARRDEDGYYWITGRVDDVLNVSGHRIGTAEVEGAIGHAAGVAEAAVVGFPHEIKGTGIYAFVTPMTGVAPGPELEQRIREAVRKHIGAHVTPDVIQFTPGLPKTRSGKIMRRILRKIAEGDLESLGDVSTLADPAVVDALVAGRPAR
jgi:acetyl-CoA synthetase